MTMFAQTDDGDFEITANGLILVSGTDEIRQRVVNALRSFFGEWFLDKRLGLPWIQVIFEKGTPPQVVDALIKNKILSVPGVISLTRFERILFDVATREVQVDFDFKASTGDIVTVEGAIP